MRRRIAWLTAPDPLDDQLDAERVVHGPADGPRGRAVAAAWLALASVALLAVLLAATVYAWLASPEMWV